MKLNKDEMKNVMGGVDTTESSALDCVLTFSDGQVIHQSCTSMNCVEMMMGACLGDGTCISGSCS